MDQGQAVQSENRHGFAKPARRRGLNAPPPHSRRLRDAFPRAVFGFCLVTIIAIVTLLGSPGAARGQQNPTAGNTVYAEAIGTANLRSGPGVNFEVVGSIAAGSRYPVLGRSARFPWFFINFGEGRGWVFVDLVKVYGQVESVPFIADDTPGQRGQPPTTPAPQGTQASPQAIVTSAVAPSATGIVVPIQSLTPSVTPSVTATAAFNVYAEAQGELNVRYGPGTDFPRIGILKPGERYPILRRHTQFNWVEIAFDQVAGGRGWILRDAVKVIGNLNSVPATNMTSFGYPSLTPTANQVVAVAPPWAVNATVAPDPKLAQIGDGVFKYLLSSKFEPNSPRVASAFLMDLKTGAAVSLVPGVAFSGMSLIKIPILVEVYRKLDNPPTDDIAVELAQMMICSNNDATNAMLALSGDGDMVVGARAVTETLSALSLSHTFITSPIRSDPRATLAPVGTIKTTADQQMADPDPFNQATPADLGQLLAAIYTCARDGTGPLIDRFNGQFTVTECRQMIRLLSSDKIGVMIEAGVPSSVQVAHKHGWVDETLGDAGIVFSPGGAFVLVVMMYERPVLIWPNEFPRVSEIARAVYNAYNPTAPQPSVVSSIIPEVCTLPDALMRDLRALELPGLNQ
jgi:uncharacterized protein YraI